MSESLITEILPIVYLSMKCIFVLCIFVFMYKILTSGLSPKKTAVAHHWNEDEVSDLRNTIYNIRIAPLNELTYLVKCAKIKYRYCVDMFDVVYKEKLINLGYECNQAPFVKREACIRRYWLTTLVLAIFLYFVNYYAFTNSIFPMKVMLGLLFDYVLYWCAFQKKGTAFLKMSLIFYALTTALYIIVFVDSSFSDGSSSQTFINNSLGLNDNPTLLGFCLIFLRYLTGLVFMYFSFRLYQINKEARGRKLLHHFDIQEDM